MESYTHERHVAELAVLQASILTKRVQSTVTAIHKDDNTPVSIADFAAQAILIGALHRAFPNDSFVGEETASALRNDDELCHQVYKVALSASVLTSPYTDETPLQSPSSIGEMLDWIDLGGSGKGGDKGRYWVMDPVDGTATFLRGQQYAVSLSLIDNGKEAVGVLGCPNISSDTTRVSENNIDKYSFGIMLTAVRGQGATIRAMSIRGLGEAFPLKFRKPCRPEKLHIVGCTACQVTRHDVLIKLAGHFNAKFPEIEVWSSHIRYAALIVGGGNAHFWVPAGPESKMHIWDHAGTQLIFTEIGGKVTDLDGKAVDFGAGRDLNRNRGLIVARDEIHESLLVAMDKILKGA